MRAAGPRAARRELRTAREALLEQLPLFHGWAIANTAYALGKLGVGNAPAFEEAWVCSSGLRWRTLRWRGAAR